MMHLLFLFVSSLLATNVFYVAQDGSDIDGNGNKTSPFATLNKAVYQIEWFTGGVGSIYIEPGLYNQSLYSSRPNIVINITAPEGQVKFENMTINFSGYLLSIDNLSISLSNMTLSNTLFIIQNSQVENLISNIKWKDDPQKENPQIGSLSSLVFRNSIFEIGVVDVSGISLLVEGCTFRNLQTIRFSRFEEYIYIRGSSFIDNHGMVEVASSLVNITLSEFVGNVGLSTGALETGVESRESDVLYVKDTMFINNTALEDGWHNIAPAVATSTNATFIQCYFSCNKAYNLTSAPPVWENENGATNFVNCSSDPTCPATCRLGWHSRQHLISCQICPAGSISNSTISVKCLACESGYSTEGRPGYTECFPCTAGTYSGRDGTPMCIPCSPGSFSPNETSTTCTPCSPGTFQPNPSSTSCFTCASGSVSVGSSRDCKICGEETYASPNGDRCLPCSIWLTSSPGSLSCTKPSWVVFAIAGGILFVFLLVLGIIVVKFQKHRAGYFAVKSIWNGKNSALVDEA